MTRPKRDTGVGIGPLEKELHQIGEAEFLAQIEVYAGHMILKCLVPGCGFELTTRWELLRDTVMTLRGNYRDRRSLKHEEYRGKTRYHFIVDKGAAGWRPQNESTQ